MTDSGSDGWNQNYIGFRQNNSIMGYIGDTFINGSKAGPVYVVVRSNVTTEIVVYKMGTKTNQIGFIVTASNGTKIY